MQNEMNEWVETIISRAFGDRPRSGGVAAAAQQVRAGHAEARRLVINGQIRPRDYGAWNLFSTFIDRFDIWLTPTIAQSHMYARKFQVQQILYRQEGDASTFSHLQTQLEGGENVAGK